MTNKTVFKSEQGRQVILDAYADALAQWPVPYEPLWLPTRLGQTFALACGPQSAPPLVLLHGSTANSAMWMGDIGCYSSAFRVYALDVPGEPGRSEPQRPSLSGPAYVDWLEDILAALQLDRICLVGISLGGFLAIKFAAAHPARVEKLALLCPCGVAPQRMSFLLKVIPLLMMGEWGRDQAARLVYGKQSLPADALRYTRLLAGHFNPRTEVIPLFTDVELARLTMPTLLLAGAHDALLPSHQTLARLEQRLPSFQGFILPEAGHVLINLSSTVMDFLQAPASQRANPLPVRL